MHDYFDFLNLFYILFLSSINFSVECLLKSQTFYEYNCIVKKKGTEGEIDREG